MIHEPGYQIVELLRPLVPRWPVNSPPNTRVSLTIGEEGTPVQHPLIIQEPNILSSLFHSLSDKRWLL